MHRVQCQMPSADGTLAFWGYKGNPNLSRFSFAQVSVL